MTLLHIFGLAPRAPVAVRIKCLCACIRWPTQARPCPLLFLNTKCSRTELERAILAAALAFEAKYRLHIHCASLARLSPAVPVASCHACVSGGSVAIGGTVTVCVPLALG